MPGKIITRDWQSRGPLGRLVKHTAYGYTLTINGKRERKFSSAWSTRDDAYQALIARQKEMENGMAATRRDVTLGDLSTEYLKYKEQRGKRSLSEDRRMLNTRILPALGTALQARRLTAAAIAQYERRRAGEVTAFTVANELAVLRHMLRLGRRWGYIDEVPEIEFPKRPEGRRRYLDEAELGRLLAACRKSKNPYLTTVVTIAVHTGMRKAEILGLEWERVDLSTGRITLYETKSGSPRGVPMNRAVYDALVATAPAEERVGPVFRRRNGGEWGSVRTAFATALKRAAITGFRFHDLRHTAASHLVMRGASLKEVQEVLGHKDFKMTLRYAHLSPSHLRAAVDRLDGLTTMTAPAAHDGAQNAKLPTAALVSA